MFCGACVKVSILQYGRWRVLLNKTWELLKIQRKILDEIDSDYDAGNVKSDRSHCLFCYSFIAQDAHSD